MSSSSSFWIAVKSSWSLLLRLPRCLFSGSFGDFGPQQLVPKVPRILLVGFKVLMLTYPIFFLFGCRKIFNKARNAIYRLMLAHLRKSASRISRAEPVREVDVSELQSHLENFYDHPAPFVVRNFHRDTPAIKEWSAGWFAKHYGDFLCSSSEVADHTPRKLSGLLADDAYVNFLDRIFRVHPELEDQLQMADVAAKISGILGIEPTYNELFLSTKSGSGSSLHCHSVWNFFMQVDGYKKWTLVDPECSHLVYSMDPSMEFGTLQGLHADPSDFPLFQYCPRYEVTLNPGDLFFNPPMWWHRVENQAASGDKQPSIVGVTLKYYDSPKSIITTYSNPQFNRFNELQCIWRSLFIVRHAKIVSRKLTKYSTDPSQPECPVQARIWPRLSGKKGFARHWRRFRDICLNDPESNQY